MKAAVYNTERGVPEIHDVPIPEIADDEMLVKPMSVGVCGSEVLTYRLKGPGSFGHEPAGIVVKTGKNVRTVKEGDRVFIHHRVPCFVCRYCRRGHHAMCSQYLEMGFDPSAYSEFARVKARNVEYDTIPLPDHISYDEGCVIEILSCIWRALKRANIYYGDSVMIVGAGFVGCAAVQCAKILGAGKVFISDLEDFKLQKAMEVGADGVINPTRDDVLEKLLELNDGRKAENLVTIVGSIKVFQDSLKLVDRGGTVAQFGPFAEGATFEWEPNSFFYPEISYIPTYSASPFETKEVADYLFGGRIQVKSLITHHYPLDQIKEALEMKKKAVGSLKIVVHPNGMEPG